MDPLVYANFLHEVAGKAPMLSPGKRLAIGLLLVGVGAGLLFDVRGRILPALPWVAMLGGLAVLAFAARALRERRQLEREVADVLARWDELAAGVAAAAGQGIARYLHEQGVRRYEVRRYLLRRLGGDAAAPGPRASIPIAADEWMPANLQPDRPRPEPPSGPWWIGRG